MRVKIKQVKFADLHVHTSFSDSTFSPTEVIQHAADCGLCAIAITDHDCISGIPPIIKPASQHNIEIIPGVELTAEAERREIHILGLYIDYNNKNFVKELDKICENRLERIHKMVGKLKEVGIDVAAEEVLKLGGAGSVGRLHLARVLNERGYISSTEEAFKRFIGDNGPCYVKRLRLAPKRAIEMINAAGGIAVLAHPYLIHQDSLIPQLIEDGLGGIEIYCPSQSEFGVNKYEDLARSHNLIITGGSDCHGLAKSEVSMGKVKVPYELVEKLKSYISQI